MCVLFYFLSLFVFVYTVFLNGVNMLEPLTFAFLIIGGMIPFSFAAMTMKSVGLAAMEMVMEDKIYMDWLNKTTSVDSENDRTTISKLQKANRIPPATSLWAM